MPMFTYGPKPNFKRWVTITKHTKFTCMTSMIGHRGAVGDPDALRIYLEPDASDLELGDALSRTLAKSRVVEFKRNPDAYDYRVSKRLYDDWIAEVKARYGFRSEAQFEKESLHCMVRVTRKNMIMIEPYERIGDDQVAVDHEDSIYLPWKSPKPVIGAALRQAFSLCS